MASVATRRDAAGGIRLSLRDTWNNKELDIAEIFTQFDTNKDGGLNKNELVPLLQQYYNISKKEPTEEEIDFVFTVADKDNDGAIQERELMFGMSVWWAMHQDMSVDNLEMPEFDMESGLTEQLKKYMEKLNGGVNVPQEEVNAVLARAYRATKTMSTSTANTRIQNAVCEWMMNVERAPTSRSQIATHETTASAARHGLTRQPSSVVTGQSTRIFAEQRAQMQQLFALMGSGSSQDASDQPQFGQICCLLACVLLTIVACACITILPPLLEISYAESGSGPQYDKCASRTFFGGEAKLSTLVKWKGYVGLVVVLFNSLKQEDENKKNMCVEFIGTCLSWGLTFQWLNVFQVTWDIHQSPEWYKYECYQPLLSFSWAYSVVVPCILCFVVCPLCCCLICFAVAKKGDHDDRLQRGPPTTSYGAT